MNARVALLGATLVIALVVGIACGGDDSASKTTGPSPTKEVPTLTERIAVCDSLFAKNGDGRDNNKCVSAAATNVTQWQCYVTAGAAGGVNRLEGLCLGN